MTIEHASTNKPVKGPQSLFPEGQKSWGCYRLPKVAQLFNRNVGLGLAAVCNENGTPDNKPCKRGWLVSGSRWGRW